MSKEEIFKVEPKEEIEKKSEEYWVRVKFDVWCDSSPYVQYERSLAARVAKYVNDCFEAMDESMRHWGDHHHMIEPVSIKLLNSEESGNDDNEGIELVNELSPYWNNMGEQYDILKIESWTPIDENTNLYPLRPAGSKNYPDFS
jgi:hypothetical protein